MQHPPTLAAAALWALWVLSTGRGCPNATRPPDHHRHTRGRRLQHAGQFVPGVAVLYPVFATVLDLTRTRDITIAGGGGARNQIDRIYRVRWFEELALAPPTSIEVTSELGVVFAQQRVGKISEYVGRFGDLRRRWLDIEIVIEQAARL